jgi:prophage regulatory protein
MEQRFPIEGLVRLKDILGPAGPVPVSRAHFWAMKARTGFPRSVKLSPRVTCFYASDIQLLLASPENWGGKLRGGDHAS